MDAFQGLYFGRAPGPHSGDFGPLLGVSFGDHFGHFWGTVLGSIFRGSPGTSKISSSPKVGGDSGGI